MVVTRSSLRSATRRTHGTRITALPDRVFEVILQGLSSRPTHPDWQQFVSLEDAISSFRTHGTLYRVARSVFSSVSSDYSFFEGDGNRLRFKEGDWTEEENCNFLRFMAAAGRSISSIAFTQNDLALLSERGRQILLDTCSNVTRARFHFIRSEPMEDFFIDDIDHIQGQNNVVMADAPNIPEGEEDAENMGEFDDEEEDPFDTASFFDQFMNSRRGQLKFLQLNCRCMHQEYIDAIMLNGKGIEELQIKPSQLSEDTQTIWLVVGPTLKNLTIDFSGNFDDEEFLLGHVRTMLANVSVACRNIRRLTLKVAFDEDDFTDQVRELVLNLATSYGEQLEYLSVDLHLPLETLSTICEACPNVNIPVCAPILKLASETLEILEKTSCNLHYYLKKPHEFESEEQKMQLVKRVTSNDFKIVARRCHNVQDIMIFLPGIVIGPLLRAFLSSPKQSLKTLSVKLYRDPINYERDISTIMKALEKPNYLESFTCQLYCAKPHSFKNFALKSPCLRKVYIAFDAPLEFADFNAIHLGLISAFTNCTKLKSLVIDQLIIPEYEPEGPSAAIRTASRLLRSRGVYVEVNQIPYC